jgi:hypothetical protein
MERMATSEVERQTSARPGMAPARLVRLMRSAVEEMRLDLRGAVVLTEAATGPYVVTPVLAALAGADEVLAVTRPSRYGSVEQVRELTHELARHAGVEERVLVTADRPESLVGPADVVTNSGHVRPIDGRLVAAMKPGAVVPLMFEAWELDSARSDLDLDALRRRGIPVAGTNERHPAVGVFAHLGLMAVRLLLDAGTAVRGTSIALLCDNPFRSYLESGLEAAGAVVNGGAEISELVGGPRADVVLVALRPRNGGVLDRRTAAEIARVWPDVVVVQFWGEIDRLELRRLGLDCWPPTAPPAGHMAVLPSDLGPEPVVRLQAGGLKVASVLRTPKHRRTPFDLEFLDEL